MVRERQTTGRGNPLGEGSRPRPPKVVRCKACELENRDDLNRDLGNGLSPALCAIGYGISADTIRRHWANHVLQPLEGKPQIILTLRDVVDIPLQMRERGMLLNRLIELTLEPLYNAPGHVDGRGINAVQTGFLVQLLRLQQHDEETIMKATGILKESGDAKADMVVTDAYRQIQAMIQRQLLDVTDTEGPEMSRDMTLRMAEMLLPMKELTGGPDPYKYSDLDQE
jgi:hypothetical protein